MSEPLEYPPELAELDPDWEGLPGLPGYEQAAFPWRPAAPAPGAMRGSPDLSSGFESGRTEEKSG